MHVSLYIQTVHVRTCGTLTALGPPHSPAPGSLQTSAPRSRGWPCTAAAASGARPGAHPPGRGGGEVMV